MERITLYILSTIVLAFISLNSYSQQGHTMYNMDRLGQAHYENPAFTPNGKVYVGFAFSQHSVGAYNSGFLLSKAFKTRAEDDSLLLDQEAIKNMLRDRNYIDFNVRNEILGFGFKVKDNYFSFSASNRVSSSIVYPKDLLVLAMEGNGRSLFGKRASLDGLGFNLNGYMEYALGYNRKLGEKLDVGARLKLLSGYANFSTIQSNLGITTEEDGFDITIDGQLKFASSGFADIFDTTGSDFDPTSMVYNLYNFKNLGLALDLGATYNLNEKIKLSASLLDLGYIHWKEKTAHFETDDLYFRFEGVNINNFLNDSTDYLDNMVDSLLDKIDNDITGGTYKRMINSRFYLGAKYQLNDMFSVSATSYNQIMGNKLRMAGIFSGNIEIGNWLDFTMNYTIYGRSYSNLGVGLALRGGPVQFFVMADNVLAMNYATAKNFHVSTGISLLIGKLDDSKDKKRIRQEKKEEKASGWGKEVKRKTKDEKGSKKTVPNEEE